MTYSADQETAMKTVSIHVIVKAVECVSKTTMERIAIYIVDQRTTLKMGSIHVIVGAVECVLKTTLERSAIASQPTALTMASIPVIARVVECVPKITMEKSAKCTALQKTVTSWVTICVPVMVAESVWRDTRVGAPERTAQSVFPPQAAVSSHIISLYILQEKF